MSQPISVQDSLAGNSLDAKKAHSIELFFG